MVDSPAVGMTKSVISARPQQPGRRRWPRACTASAAALGVLTAACAGPEPPPSPGKPVLPIRGYVRTSGTELVDESGARVVLQGANDGRLSAGAGNQPIGPCRQVWQPIPQSEMDNFADWGFNSVRLGISWANLEPEPPTVEGGETRHVYNREYLEAVDAAVEGFGRRGVKVILDMHAFGWSPALTRAGGCLGEGMPVWLYLQDEDGDGTDDVPAEVTPKCDFFADRPEQGVPVTPWDGFEAVWRMLVERYRDDDAVIAADLVNEPELQLDACPDVDLDDFYARMGPAINEANPELLVTFAKRGDDRSPPPSGSNWIYTKHHYLRDWIPGVFEGELAKAREWDVPLWLGEFSHVRAGLDRLDLLASKIRFLRSRGISWSYFEYDRQTQGRLADFDGTQTAPQREIVAVLQEGLGLPGGATASGPASPGG